MTSIVRWKNNNDISPDIRFGIISPYQSYKYAQTIVLSNNLKTFKTDLQECLEVNSAGGSNEIQELVDYLISINSDIIKYIGKGTISQNIRKCMENISIPKNYNLVNNMALSQLFFATHPDVIKWVKNTNPKNLQIVNSKGNYKITVLCRQKGFKGINNDMILVSRGAIFHL